MAKDPAFLLYSADLLTGMSDMTWEERGQYITMLCIQHQKGSISTKWLSINLPNASTDVLAKFKKDDDGNYYSPRLSVEIDKRADKHPKKIAASVLGGLISSRKLKKPIIDRVKKEFDISIYEHLEADEIKHKLTEWFNQMVNQMVNVLEDENENENRNENNKGGSGGKMKRPELSEVYEYFFLQTQDSVTSEIESKKFFNFYESKGWKVGKTPMKDWKAAIRGWISRDNGDRKTKTNGAGGGKTRTDKQQEIMDELANNWPSR